MADDCWAAVDRYVQELLAVSNPVLDAVLSENAAAALPHIDVSPGEGKFLHLLARVHGARQILEIGTLGGYSTIWLARALPSDGLEAEEKHAAVARSNIARAGLSTVVDLRVGRALDTLPQLEGEGKGAFDFVFVDADKANNPEYLRWALRLSHRGALILIDNVVRDGAILNPNSSNHDIQGIRRMFEMLRSESRVSATALQTVGVKGHDGFVQALVTGE
jgi:predicted O-methyltransferase YrrM